MRAVRLFISSLLLLVSASAFGETEDIEPSLNENPNSPVSIEVWSSFQGDLLDIAAIRFQHETGNELAIRQFSSTFELRSELLIAQLFGTYVPDLVWMPSDFIGLHDYMGLSPFPNDWVDKTLFEQRSIDSLSLDGQFFGVPLSLGNHLMLYYDKRRVTKPATSWEALISASRSMDKPILAITLNDAYFFNAFFSLYYPTSPLVSFEFDQQATEQTLTFVRSLIELGVIVADCNHQCGREKLLNGEVDYLIDGDWALSHLPAPYAKSHLAIAPTLPTWRDKEMISFSGGKVIAITEVALAETSKRDVLRKFIELIQDPVFLSELKREAYHVSAVSSLNNDKHYSALEKAIYEQYLRAQPMPIDPRLSIGWESLARTLQRVDEGMPIDQAALFFEEFFFKYQQRLK
ncbi:sugar ABC transporter substrate-binding protein [Vibrio astriarenae]|uniref:sugar ABC transporter substrate-binding protein n=1 Tax=Vibrio astriarenae TaxID=1481923 RepID=UPI003735E5BB